MNILIFADFARWPPTSLEQFIDYIEEICTNEHDTNRIVLSYNPVLTICLASIHLIDIGNSISLFKNRGHSISLQLQELGECIIGEMEKE